LNFERFHQIRNSTKVLSVLLSNANSWKIIVLRLISYAQTAREHRQTIFPQIQPITQTTVTYECAT